MNLWLFRRSAEERNEKCNNNRRNDKCCPQQNETPETTRDSDRQQFLDTSGQRVHQQGLVNGLITVVHNATLEVILSGGIFKFIWDCVA